MDFARDPSLWLWLFLVLTLGGAFLTGMLFVTSVSARLPWKLTLPFGGAGLLFWIVAGVLGTDAIEAAWRPFSHGPAEVIVGLLLFAVAAPLLLVLGVALWAAAMALALVLGAGLGDLLRGADRSAPPADSR